MNQQEKGKDVLNNLVTDVLEDDAMSRVGVQVIPEQELHSYDETYDQHNTVHFSQHHVQCSSLFGNLKQYNHRNPKEQSNSIL